MARFEPVSPHELAPALARLLAGPDGVPAAPLQVAAFQTYMTDAGLAWLGWRSGPPESPQALFLALLPPGRTALVLVPVPGAHGIRADVQIELSRNALEALGPQRLHYAQALVEPGSTARVDLLNEVGFRLLTNLLYLERDAVYPWIDPPGPGEATWRPYSPERDGLFEEVVAATYRESRDCPELSSLRPVSAALAAHRATGRFDSALWEVALCDGRPSGVLLLAEIAQGALLDVVYMGVVPEFRQRGVGGLLLRRALAQCRARRVRRLTAVVDARNEPARRLYARLALRPTAERVALLYCWR